MTLPIQISQPESIRYPNPTNKRAKDHQKVDDFLLPAAVAVQVCTVAQGPAVRWQRLTEPEGVQLRVGAVEYERRARLHLPRRNIAFARASLVE